MMKYLVIIIISNIVFMYVNYVLWCVYECLKSSCVSVIIIIHNLLYNNCTFCKHTKKEKQKAYKLTIFVFDIQQSHQTD